MAHKFITDANGYDLVEHEVWQKGVEFFSATLVPVDAQITASDYAKEHSLTVWNDRPQAGAVHYDSSIKLLI